MNGDPGLLVRSGVVIDTHLRSAGMTRADLLAALRGRGYDRVDEIEFAVLEVDGTVSVIAEPKT